MKYLPTVEMSHEDWLKERKIGGSSVASILGINPWASPLDAYNQLIDPIGTQIETNSRMIAGNKLEAVVMEYWTETTGKKAVQDNKIRIHPEHDFLRANMDGVILADDEANTGVLEVKTTGYFTWKSWNGAIPEHYYCQLQHYLNVTGYSWGEFAVLVDGHDFHNIRFERDQEFIDLVTAQLVRFWNNHVLTKTPPEPMNDNDLKTLYPSHIPDKTIEAVNGMSEQISQLVLVKDEIKILTDSKKEMELRIKKEMGDAEAIMQGEDMLVTWKQGKAKQMFNKKSFGVDHPDLLDKYTTEKAGNRTFLIK
jgi:putative phage-type endonuclease